MKKLKWTKTALGDVREMEEYYFPLNPFAAEKLMNRIYYAPEILKTYPRLGRDGRVKGTREWIVTDTHYIVVYRSKSDSIEILRVIHTARIWPEAV